MVNDAVLNDNGSCEILRSMSNGEAEVFANCVVQNMKALYDACAKSRADVRKREDDLVEKRKKAAKVAAEKRAAKKAAEEAKAVKQEAKPASQDAKPVSSQVVQPQPVNRPSVAQG